MELNGCNALVCVLVFQWHCRKRHQTNTRTGKLLKSLSERVANAWPETDLQLLCHSLIFFIFFYFFKTLIPMFPFCCLSTFKFPCFKCSPIYSHVLKLYCRNAAPGGVYKWFTSNHLLPPKICKADVSANGFSQCVLGALTLPQGEWRLGVCITTQTCHGSGSNISQGAFIEQTTTVYLCTKMSDGLKWAPQPYGNIWFYRQSVNFTF